MIPIRTSVDVPGVPGAVVGLIIANLVMFVMQVGLPTELAEQFIRHNALVPGRYGDPAVAERLGLSPYNLLPFLTNTFMHGGVFHLLVNMWTLWLLGRPVEQRLGAARFVALYLASGIAGGVLHVVFHLSSAIPALGASGAIAGVLGAYALSYPRSKIILLSFVLIFPWTYELTATVYMALWFVFQVVAGMVGLVAPADVGGVAWWAHIGGFVCGFALTSVIGAQHQWEKEIGPAHEGPRAIGAERPRIVRVDASVNPGRGSSLSGGSDRTTRRPAPAPMRQMFAASGAEPAQVLKRLARSLIPDSAAEDKTHSPPSPSQSAPKQPSKSGPWG
jgi:membrane associated rhomboid family serine protease